jgi:hypothetical protein
MNIFFASLLAFFIFLNYRRANYPWSGLVSPSAGWR